MASGQGGGHLIFDVCFDFQCATPRGLIRWVTVWGNYSLLAANSIFHCVTPRGLIRWVTVWGNGALLGLNSIFHCATPRGLIRWVTVWLLASPDALEVILSLTHRGVRAYRVGTGDLLLPTPYHVSFPTHLRRVSGLASSVVPRAGLQSSPEWWVG